MSTHTHQQCLHVHSTPPTGRVGDSNFTHTQQPTSPLRTRSYMVWDVVTMIAEKKIPSSDASDCINAHTKFKKV